jgi:nucleoside-diphosphate-sugar epimerase
MKTRTSTARQNILLTGSTGFAGRYAVKRLSKDGHRVYCLVRSRRKLQSEEGAEIIEIPNPEKTAATEYKRIFEEHKITAVVHIAAIRGENRGVSWSRYLEVNVEWTKNLAQAFLDAEVDHDKFVYTSSVGVYGTIPQCSMAPEETVYNPDGAYHRSKVLAEKELLELQTNSGLPLIILRPTIIYGNQDVGFLYKVSKLMKKKYFPLSGANPIIHLLDAELLADVYAEIVAADYKSTPHVFNVADREPIKIQTLTQYISKSMDARSLKVPSFVFTTLRKLCAFSSQYSVSLKLISKSWSYNVDTLYGTFNLKSMGTIQALDKKYFVWYNGAEHIG